MKTLFKTLFLYIPGLALVTLALISAIAWQQNMITAKDFKFLVQLGQTQGLAAVVSVIQGELYGYDEIGTDPSYGREQVAGRGHAPWVIRGNLDGRPRVLKFALAPGVWAAYETETASLYQVWQGDVMFEGAAYNYNHGPQPSSIGQWFLRNEQPVSWFIDVAGESLPATVRYLGHEYGPGRLTAGYRIRLEAGTYALELLEYPELIERDGQQFFQRRFQTLSVTAVERSAPVSEAADLEPVAAVPAASELPGGGAGETEIPVAARFEDAAGNSQLAQGTLEFALTSTSPIPVYEGTKRGRVAEVSELELGISVIEQGDCLACHAPNHKVTGPAWSQIAAKFRGYVQDEVVAALTASVRSGSVGTWGKVPMPAHPNLSETQARAAVVHILSVEEASQDLNPPLDVAGNPYASTLDYDIKPRVTTLHPSFALENIAPPGFEPKVGGMEFRSDGKLLIASWDRDGAVFLVDPRAPMPQRVKRIAEGLQEPLGLTVVDDRIFVLQKQELTELIDLDGDDVIDRYSSFSYDWPSSANFHSFAFGLLHSDDYFHLLLSICVLPGGASCPDQLPTQGKLLRIGMDGKADILAAGFRTPNGIGRGANDEIYVNDNQGDWLPASKLVHIRPGHFYGSRAVAADQPIEKSDTAPVVWLPQDEIGNSPTAPFLLQEGPYAGQMIHGDVYNGGVKRVFIEEVDGAQQGAVFQFSGGFHGAVNRMARGPGGNIYLGEIGNPPNWGEYGLPWFGLERLKFVRNRTFELLAVRAEPDGFTLELTEPLADAIAPRADDLVARQWFYHPNEQYGGPKYDPTELSPTAVSLSSDRRRLRFNIPGLKAGYVVYLRLDDRYRSELDRTLWASEAWYTLNAIPEQSNGATSAAAEPAPDNLALGKSWTLLFDGTTLDGWRNYKGSEDAVQKWQVQNGALALTQQSGFPLWTLIRSYLFGGASGDLIYYREKFRDFELRLDWKISPNGNSGIFYLVADEKQNSPWLTGVEMQVLDNDGHDDGEIITHRAGDLYDLIAADPETVRPVGQWNKVRIRVRNNRIEHWLNGTKVLEVTRGSEQWDTLVANSKFSSMADFGKSAEGYIVLQDHGDRVWYRNIQVRRFNSRKE